MSGQHCRLSDFFSLPLKTFFHVKVCARSIKLASLLSSPHPRFTFPNRHTPLHPVTSLFRRLFKTTSFQSGNFTLFCLIWWCGVGSIDCGGDKYPAYMIVFFRVTGIRLPWYDTRSSWLLRELALSWKWIAWTTKNNWHLQVSGCVSFAFEFNEWYRWYCHRYGKCHKRVPLYLAVVLLSSQVNDNVCYCHK